VLNDAYRLNWPNVKYLELDMYFDNQLLPLSVNIIEKNFAALLPDLTVSFFCDNVIILSNNTSVLSVVSLNWLISSCDCGVFIVVFCHAH